MLVGSGLEDKSLEEVVKGSFGKNAGLFNNSGQHYNHIHFWKWMKPGGGGDKIPSKLKAKIDSDLGGVAKMKEDFRLVLARGQGRQADRDEDDERREPLGSWGNSGAGLRCVGAFLLHRLPQPAAGLPQGVPRSPGELGPRRRDVRGGEQVNLAGRE